MPNLHNVQFVQYIFAQDGKEHLIINYTCIVDFVPMPGMNINFDKPFMEWEYQVEKVLWTTSSKPKFLCKMKNITYCPGDVDPLWQSVHSFTEIRSYFEGIIDFHKELEDAWLTIRLSHYNFRDKKRPHD